MGREKNELSNQINDTKISLRKKIGKASSPRMKRTQPYTDPEK